MIMNSTLAQGPQGYCDLDLAQMKWGDDPEFLEGYREAIEKALKQGVNKEEIRLNCVFVRPARGGKYEFKIEVESQQERNPSDPIRDQDVLEKQIELLQNIHKGLFISDSYLLTANGEFRVDESEIEVLEDNSFLDIFKKIRLIGDNLLSKPVERNINSLYNCFEEHLMMECNHQHIHRCIGHYYSQSSDKINLIFEDVDENLISYLGTSPSFRTKIRICKEIAQGLWKIHSKKIAHNNLLPESIYVKNGSVRIGNFSRADYIDKLDSKDSELPRYDSRNDDIFMFGLLLLYIFKNQDMDHDLWNLRNNPEEIEANIDSIAKNEDMSRHNESLVQIIKHMICPQLDNPPEVNSICNRFEDLMTPDYDFIQIL